MAHQRFIFQESECWCPLKEDVKVDDGLEKLAFWKPKSNLTQAQNELSAFTLIFFIILFANMRYAPLSFSGIAAHIIQYYLPRLFGCTDFVDSIHSVSDIIKYSLLLEMRLLIGCCAARTTIGG